MKNVLLSRVSEAEDRMAKLVQLRNDETAKASRATARLRESINKLQQRFEDEKRELRQTVSCKILMLGYEEDCQCSTVLLETLEQISRKKSLL